MITSIFELNTRHAAMEDDAGRCAARILCDAMKHVKALASMAAHPVASMDAEIEVADWTGMEWWNHSQGVTLVVNRRDASGLGNPTVVGELFDQRFARPASASDAAHICRR